MHDKTEIFSEALERPDMLYGGNSERLKVIQISASDTLPSNHIYMESHIFTPDSTRFIFQRYANFTMNRNASKLDREYMLCDISDKCSFRLLTDEKGAKGPSISEDGKYMYYIADESSPDKGYWSVSRIDLDSFRKETILKVDSPLPGNGHRLSCLYTLTSISSDGKRLCTSGYLGDGILRDAPWGIAVIDLEKGRAEIIFEGKNYCNAHPQYCRSKEAKASHDILLQENHGCRVNEKGEKILADGGLGTDIHVICDDGSNFRSMPWARDGNEFCQGHQAWRGEMLSAVTSTTIKSNGTSTLLEAFPLPVNRQNAHDGIKIPNSLRNDLSRNIEAPYFCHFAFDHSGTKFISDTSSGDGQLIIGSIPDLPDCALTASPLLRHRSSFSPYYTHPHPFLSPDGKYAFFNSDESGLAQIYMVTGYEFPVYS